MFLHRVEIENFYSIGECQVIDLRARQSVEDDLGRLSQIYKGSKERAPNVVALFGANAAGKSSVLRSIVFGAGFMTSSFHQQPNLNLPYEKFGNEKRITQPSRLTFSYPGPADFRNVSGKGPQCPYTYELILSPRGKEMTDHVLLEKMIYRPRGHGKPTTIFKREANNTKFVKGFLTPQENSLLNRVLRPNASVISTLRQFDHKVAESWASSIDNLRANIFIDRHEQDNDEMTAWYKDNPQAMDELNRIARRIDLGIEKVGMNKSNSQLHFVHSGLDYSIPFQRESRGTQQFIKEFPYFLNVLDRGGIALIDDIDASIHPLILPEILRWFGNKKHNPLNAQLWMTNHSVSLLHIRNHRLTKEEVFFCEKDAQGCTSVYGLADIEGVRREDDFFSKYLSGEYGAVPTIG